MMLESREPCFIICLGTIVKINLLLQSLSRKCNGATGILVMISAHTLHLNVHSLLGLHVNDFIMMQIMNDKVSLRHSRRVKKGTYAACVV